MMVYPSRFRDGSRPCRHVRRPTLTLRWIAAASVRLERAVELDQDALAFDPFRAAYAASRRGTSARGEAAGGLLTPGPTGAHARR